MHPSLIRTCLYHHFCAHVYTNMPYIDLTNTRLTLFAGVRRSLSGLPVRNVARHRAGKAKNGRALPARTAKPRRPRGSRRPLQPKGQGVLVCSCRGAVRAGGCVSTRPRSLQPVRCCMRAWFLKLFLLVYQEDRYMGVIYPLDP